MSISQEYLKSIINYNPESGAMTWKFRSPTSRKNKHFNAIWGGKEAGKTDVTKTGSKYKRITIDKRSYATHRLAFLYMLGYFPVEVDHNDRDGLNNSWNNLSESTRPENMLNKSRYKSNTSGVTGVSWHKREQKWSARITVEGKRVTLGSFDNIEDAESIVKSERIKHGYTKGHGEKSVWI